MVRQRAVKKADESVGSDSHVRVSHESIDDTSYTAKVVCKCTAICIFFVYLMIPVLLYSFPQIVEQIVFMNLQYARTEPASLLSPSSEYDLHGVANFHISCDNERLGLWHILPKDNISNYMDDSLIEMQTIQDQLEDARDIIIYHHGNGMSRATGDYMHRSELYKMLQSEGYHVIAFDYRGYGDSTGWPSENGLVNDSSCVLKWVRERVSQETKVSFWGHSLGAAIATISAQKLFDKCERKENSCMRISNLIIEAGYTNIKEAAAESFPAGVFKMVYSGILFQKILTTSLEAKHIEMAVARSMAKIRCPILILHAEDDKMILAKHGDRLFEICKNTTHLKKGIKYVKFKAEHEYGHLKIVKAPELPEIIRKFFKENDDSFEQSVVL